MSKTWLSEYTDRSEKPTPESPREISERLGVPLVGGVDQDRIAETVVHKPTGVCSKCGMALYATMHFVCTNDPCPTGLGRTAFT